ncbi:hypothetical protein NKG05_16625 [Oerskovia sp. M15]
MNTTSNTDAPDPTSNVHTPSAGSGTFGAIDCPANGASNVSIVAGSPCASGAAAA